MIKFLRKVGIEGNFLNLSYLSHCGKMLDVFPVKPGKRKTCPILHYTGQPESAEIEVSKYED